MSVFMILVVNAHASVISWVGVCSDRLATVVIRRGATVCGLEEYPSQIPVHWSRTKTMLP